VRYRRALLLAVAVPTFLVAGVVHAQTAATPPPAAAAPPAPAPSPAAAPATSAPATSEIPAAPAAAPNEATTDARALAETLFFTGRGLMEGGRFAQACLKFAESYRLDPAAGTLLNLAVCHEKEGKIASSWGEFRQALAEAKRANRPEREQLAKDAIARLEPNLPFVTITVPKEVRVPGLVILRNGVPLLEAAWDTELPIDPGTNEITATAPDYKPEKKSVTAAIKQHVTITIDPLELAPVERPPPPFWTAKRKLGGGLFVGGVVLTGVGTIFGVMALGNKTTSNNNCPTFDGELRCTQAGVSAESSGKTDAWVSDFGIGLGVAALVTGGILFATGGVHEETGPTPVGVPPKEGKWDWRFTSGPHGAQGFLLQRSF